MAERYNLPYKKGRPANLSNKKTDYRYYYSDDLAELVSNTYDRELKLYGYSFDKLVCDDSNEMCGPISRSTKSNLSYVYTTNMFTDNR